MLPQSLFPTKMVHSFISIDSSTQEYLLSLKKSPSENDPAVLIDWNLDALATFVQGANQDRNPIQAAFVTSAPGQMSVTSLQNDIIAFVARVAGVRYGNCLLAPNSLSQFANVIAVLRDVEFNPWIQANMNAHVADGQFLASVYQLTDRTIVNASPVGLPAPPAGLCQVFQ